MKRILLVQLLVAWTAQVPDASSITSRAAPPPVQVTGQIPQTGEGEIRGVVRKGDGEDPISDVQITLTGGSSSEAAGIAGQLRTTTDSEGHFSFRNLPPGRYTVNIQRDGYFPRDNPNAEGGTSPASERSGTSLIIAAGRSVITVNYSMFQGGTISGRILDPIGRPAAEAVVWAARPSYRDGRTLLINSKQTMTNDRGEYRLYWLEPGEYFVLAEKNLTTGPTRSYYPRGNDGSAAVRVHVEEATESGKIDFALASVPAKFTVSGVVTNLISGLETLLPVQFYMIPNDGRRLNDGFELLANTLTSNQDRAAGKFELRNVGAGPYELYAVVDDRSSSPGRYFAAHTSIDVKGDVSDVALRMAPGFDLTGKILFNGQTPIKPVRIELRPKTPFPNFNGTTIVSTNGTFAANLPESPYMIRVDSPEPFSYVDEISQGANSVLDRGVVTAVRGLPDSLEVRLKSPASRVRGAVLGTPLQLSGRIVVSLVPEDSRRENFSLYKRVIAQADGTFTIDTVAPGRYKLYAWEQIPDGAEQNGEFMEAYKDLGTEIEVPGENTPINLRLISK